MATMTRPKATTVDKADKTATTAGSGSSVRDGLEVLREMLDLYGRAPSELTMQEQREAITGHELKARIEALVRAITGQEIQHIYAGSGAATSPGLMILPRIAGTLLFSPREVRIILGYTAHELSHQLLTDFDLILRIYGDIEKPTTREQQVKEFWNGIEDYRIERESRRAYPGFPLLINETRDHTARRFVKSVDEGAISASVYGNAYRIGSVALTWIGARLNNYVTRAPDEALMRIPEELRAWLQSWDRDMAAVVTCEDAKLLAVRILDELDRMRENPPEEPSDSTESEQDDDSEDRDEGSPGDRDEGSPGDRDEGSPQQDGESAKGKKQDSDESDEGETGDDRDAGDRDDSGDPEDAGNGEEAGDDAGAGTKPEDDEGPDGSDGDGADERDDGATEDDAADAGDADAGDADGGDADGEQGDEAGGGPNGEQTEKEKGAGGSPDAGEGKGDGDGPDEAEGRDGDGSGESGDQAKEKGKPDGEGEKADGEGETADGAGSDDVGSDGAGSEGSDADGDERQNTQGAGKAKPSKDRSNKPEGDREQKNENDQADDQPGKNADAQSGDGDSGPNGSTESGDARHSDNAADGDDEAGGDDADVKTEDAAETGGAKDQGKERRRPDIRINEGDQEAKAEEADLAIDELIQAINEASANRQEAETPDVRNTDQVAAARIDTGPVGRQIVKATGTEKYSRIRQSIGSSAARSAGVVRRLLQSRNRTRHRTGLEEGVLDFGRLVPMALGSSDVYRETRTTTQINTALTLLLDNSGSMTGNPLLVCQKTAIVLDMAVQGTPTAIEIAGFTSTHEGTRIYQYRNFDQRSVSASASLGNMDQVELGGTPVATPILESWRRMRMRKEPRKIMILVSDGGASDPEEARAAAEIVEMQGGIVIGIAIGSDIYMRQWCDRVVGITDIEQLPQALTQIIQEHLGK